MAWWTWALLAWATVGAAAVAWLSLDLALRLEARSEVKRQHDPQEASFWLDELWESEYDDRPVAVKGNGRALLAVVSAAYRRANLVAPG